MKKLLALVMLGSATCALAQMPPGPGPGGRPGPNGPLPEAVQACQGKAPGSPCRFTSPRGESRVGSCDAPPPRPSGERSPGADRSAPPPPPPPLSCRPDDRPPPRGAGGPGGGR